MAHYHASSIYEIDPDFFLSLGVTTVFVSLDNSLENYSVDKPSAKAYELKEELKKVEGEFSVSTFVKKVTGVDNVCERSAVYTGGTLRIRKQAENGVTAAFAWDNWRVKFE